MFNHHNSLIIISCVMFSNGALATESEPASAPETDSIFDILADRELVDPAVSVVTRSEQRDSEAPAVVTVITREEIAASGARDLWDVLALVPGFQAGTDIQSERAPYFRGIPGEDGKMLVLIDGLEMNEILYSIPLGWNLAAHMIERVEVIRGPGTASYGGFAELGVISVTTRQPKDKAAAHAVAEYGQRSSSPGGFVLGGEANGQHSDWSYAAQGSLGNTYIGDGNYVDFSGASAPMRDFKLQDVFVNAAVAYRNTQLRILYDDYAIFERDGLGPVLPSTEQLRFQTFIAELSTHLQLRHNLELTLRGSEKIQKPWTVDDQSSPDYFNQLGSRATLSALVNWGIIDQLSMNGGVEGFWDRGVALTLAPIGLQTLFNGRTTVDYGDIAAFAQVAWKNPIVDISAGGRLEYHTQVGASAVPRLALMRSFGPVGLKLLYSQAYRYPGIANLNLNPTLKPEQMNTLEFEVAYRPLSTLRVSANAFWVNLNHPIVYGFDEVTRTETYVGLGHVGTLGFETEILAKFPRWSVRASYSYYHTDSTTSADAYRVDSDHSVLVGSAPHLVKFNGRLSLWEHGLALGGTASIMSRREGYGAADADGNPVIVTAPPVFELGLNLAYPVLGVGEVMLGVRNLLDQRYAVFQYFNGGHAPVPTAGREIYARLVVGYD